MCKIKLCGKAICATLFVLSIIMLLPFSAYALGPFGVRDDADIYKSEEEEILNEKLRDFNAKSDWASLIYTNNKGENIDSIKEFNNNYYAQNYGKDTAGFIFTIDMEGKVFDFRTKGSAMYYFDDDKVDTLLDNVQKMLKNNQYYEASVYLVDYVTDCYENTTYNNIDIQEETVPTRDYSLVQDKGQFSNPARYCGKSKDYICEIFGDDYAGVDELDSGLTTFMCYPRTGNPLEFGIDDSTNCVSCIYVYSSDERTVILFDDITNNSTMQDIKNSNTAYKYNKRTYYNALHDRDEQEITYKTNEGIEYIFTWTDSDFESEPCYRVLIRQGEVPDTTVTTQPITTNPITKPSSAEYTTENILTTAASAKTDNGFLLTGVAPTITVVVILLATVGFGIFMWYRKRGE